MGLPDKTDGKQPNRKAPALMINTSSSLLYVIWKENFFHSIDAQAKPKLPQTSSPKPAQRDFTSTFLQEIAIFFQFITFLKKSKIKTYT